MNTNSFKKWALLGMVVAVGLVALWRLFGHDDGERQQPEQTAKAEAKSSDAAQGPCRLVVGDTASWEIDEKSTFKLDPALFGGNSTANVPDSSLAFHAVLDVEVLRDEGPDGAVLLGRLRDVDAETLARSGDLSTPFLLRVGRDCSVDAFARHTSAGLTPARAQQAALHELWWKQPKTRKEDVRGINGAGAFTAIVAKAADKRGDFAQRRIVRYTEAYGASPRVPEVADSLLTVRYGAHGWFDSMEGREEMAGAGVSEASARLAVRSLPVAADAFATADHAEAAYKWENLLPRTPTALTSAPRPFTDQELREQAAVAGLSFNAAFFMFAQVVASEPNIDSQWRPMARWLEAHPEQIPTYAGALLVPGFPAKLEGVAFMALGKARVPEARNVLTQMRASADVEPYDRIRSTLALVGRDDVGVELAQQLHASAQVLTHAEAPHGEAMYARNALLGLGMMAGLRAGSAPAIASEAKGAVLDALATATTAHQLSPVFAAIGNIGDLSMLPTIAPWSRHPDVEIRALVPDAISRLKWQDVGEFTLEWLARETSPMVKESIYRVIRAQLTEEQKVAPPELVAQAILDLRMQPPLFTRQSLVRILGPAAETNQAARLALAEQAPHEIHTTSGLYTAIAQYVPAADMTHAFRLAEAGALQPPKGTTQGGFNPLGGGLGNAMTIQNAVT